MGFYDLSKEERTKLVAEIQHSLLLDLKNNQNTFFIKYFSDEDTYIRKAGYESIGRLYNSEVELRANILNQLLNLANHENELIRQSSINSAGEIGKFQFEKVIQFFDTALFDEHHKVRNAVIGSMKKMGQKNPKPLLAWTSR